MTTALAPRTNGAAMAQYIEPSADTFTIPGMENVTPDELRIPILRLVQAQSRIDGKEGHEGEWHNSVTGEFSKHPELLMIGVSKGRIMFPDEYNADNKALCASDNGSAPRDEFVGKEIETVGKDLTTGRRIVSVQAIPPVCAECPFSLWGDDGKPPACSAVAVFAGVEEDGLPVLLQIRSAGMQAVGGLKTMIAANGIRKSIRVGSSHKADAKGNYFVPVFTIGDKPAVEWQATAMRLARLGNMAARNQAAAMAEDAPAGNASTGNGDGAPQESGEPDDGGLGNDPDYVGRSGVPPQEFPF
jgi:hypothetical protein